MDVNTIRSVRRGRPTNTAGVYRIVYVDPQQFTRDKDTTLRVQKHHVLATTKAEAVATFRSNVFMVDMLLIEVKRYNPEKTRGRRPAALKDLVNS